MNARDWEIGEHVLRVARADLTALDVEVIVNAANEYLHHGGGLAGAMVRVGGQIVQDESDEWVRTHGPLESGTAAITSAGAMPARWIVHVAGPRYRDGQDNAGLLATAADTALRTASGLGARSIALPVISAGIFGYPLRDAAGIIARRCVVWLRNRPGTLSEVTLTGLNDDVVASLNAGVEAAL